MCLNSMSISIIDVIIFATLVLYLKDKDTFLSDDHIWRCKNLTTISPKPGRYLVQNFRNFQTYHVLSNDGGLKVERETLHLYFLCIHAQTIAPFASCHSEILVPCLQLSKARKSQQFSSSILLHFIMNHNSGKINSCRTETLV